MTNYTYRRRKKRYSLYIKLLLYILFGVLISGAAYLFLLNISHHSIGKYYAIEDFKTERREAYVTELEEYAETEGLYTSDTEKIAEWAEKKPYLYIIVYKNNKIIYSSDEGKSEGSLSEINNEKATGFFSYLGIGNRVDRAELKRQTEEGSRYTVRFEDGTLFVSLTDYSEELLYNIASILSMVIGVLILCVVLFLYFGRIVLRIKRLESDVNIVTHINMNHNINCEGEDELAFLSRNVENMRYSMLENIEKERVARDANTELITAMSHDIRTPLTVLLGYIDMLKNHEVNDETVKSYISATERTALRLKNLSDDMFKYSLAFGDPELETEILEYEAKMLFDQLLSEHILLLTESGYLVNVDNKLELLDDKATIYTDPQNLMRVIDNIFQNIYKYADKEKPVDISIRKNKNEITLLFSNGIPKTPSEAESNGIGLKTCKRLCRSIASDFHYESDGERFTASMSLKLGKLNRQKAGKGKRNFR